MFALEDNKVSTTNFDILLGEAIDNLYERTKAQLATKENFTNEDGKIPFGISRDWSKAVPSLREVGMGDELVNDILKRFEQSSFGALRQAKNGDWIIEGITWGTKAPDFANDNSDACCFTEK